MAETPMFGCLCCGYRTLPEQPPGTFEICRVCGWEDDLVQFDDPDFSGGANTLSLRESQRRWLKSVNASTTEPVERFGAVFEKDPAWRLLA